MAYDKQKAHEYYMQYRKKGLKKGRKKGTGKKKTGAKAKKTSLLAQTTSGLNDSGKIQAALVKEKLTAEMNAALSKATTQEEKDAIRVEYSQKAQQEIASLKNNPEYAQAKKEKLKSSTGKKSSGGSSSSKGGESSTEKKASERKKKAAKRRKAKIAQIRAQIEGLQSRIDELSDSQKEQVKNSLDSLLGQIRALRR